MPIEKFKVYFDKLILKLIIESNKQVCQNFPQKANVILLRCQEWIKKILGSGENLTAFLLIHFSIYFRYIDNYDQALHNLQTAHQILLRTKERFYMGFLYLQQSKLYYGINSMEPALLAARQAVAILLIEFNIRFP